MTNVPLTYRKKIRSRTWWRFACGALARFIMWMRIRHKLAAMRLHGAEVGRHIGMSRNVKIHGSKNLTIGDHVSIQSDKIDTRAPIAIGSYVIIGDGVSIITCSHDIDSPSWNLRVGGVVIEDYAWLATGATILPSCHRIGRGAVIGAGSVVVKDVPAMAVMSGNPAKMIRMRKCVHFELLPESLLGGDFEAYLHSYLREI